MIERDGYKTRFGHGAGKTVFIQIEVQLRHAAAGKAEQCHRASALGQLRWRKYGGCNAYGRFAVAGFNTN